MGLEDRRAVVHVTDGMYRVTTAEARPIFVGRGCDGWVAVTDEHGVIASGETLLGVLAALPSELGP